MKALELFAAMLTAREGYHAIHGLGPDGRGITRRLRVWHPADDWRGLARRLRSIEEPEMAVVPRQAEGETMFALTKGSVVWAVTRTGRDVEALERFRPVPTLQVSEGDSVRHTALWALRAEHRMDDVLRVCRHLAHGLGTQKKFATQDCPLRPPGALLTEGRKRPLVVKVVRADAEAVYPVAEVCRRLPRRIPEPFDFTKLDTFVKAA